MADIKVVNRTTGKLETHPVEAADRLVAESSNYDYPDADELGKLERVEQFGSTGQQATAAVESVGRTATFGAWQGFGAKTDIEGRRTTLQEQSPGVAFAAQAAGATLPGLVTGGAASAAAGALGAGARVAGAVGAVAEGAAGGLADEVEQAAIDQREVSPGRAMLIGVGGELVGRAIPAAVKAGVKGLRKAPSAAAAVAGETVEDVSEAVAKKADAKLADEAVGMPSGPERDAALAATAPAQRARADAELSESAQKASAILNTIAEEAPKKLEREIDGTSPGQIRWAAETAKSLRELAANAPEAQRVVLEESAQALLEAKNGKAIWRAAADARKQVREMRATEKAVAPRPAPGGRARRRAGGAEPLPEPVLAETPTPGVPEPGPAPAAPPPREIPLDDVRVLDKEGYLEKASPRKLKRHADDIRVTAENAFVGKSLEDLGALPIEGAESRAKIDAFKADQGFRESGMLPSHNDRARGGLPALTVEADGGVYLSNGRHRLTAALESGQEYIQANVKKYDKKGNTVWDYVGPVRVNPAKQAPVPSPAATAAPGGIRRSAKGARLFDSEITPSAPPDFSEWDPSDFGKGKGGSRAAGKGAADYSGGETLSTYQRSIVDGLKKNSGFAENGRVTGDAGKLGSEPTFHLQPDGSVKVTHGRLRMTAARELGRDTIYGKVIKGDAKNPVVVYEGPIKVGAGPRAAEAPKSGVDLGAPAANTNATPLDEADKLIASGQTDVGVWGKAGEGAADLERAASPGPAKGSPVDSLEDQLAAAERWKVGSEKARSELADQARRMRAADELKADTDRAEAAAGATGKGKKRNGLGAGEIAGAIAEEGAEYLAERALGAAIPGAGLAMKAGKFLWKRLDDQAKAQIGRVARTLLSPLTSNGRWGAARAATVMTALDRFKGGSPDARSAFEARKQMLTDVVASPQLAGQAMAQALAGLAAENPSNYVALSRRMTESLQYVANNLPATVGISLAHPTGVPITDSELRDVADLWNTAFDPASALESVARREASPVQMKTLRELHPDIYRDLQQAIIGQAPATFAQLDSQTKISIDIMFGSDGVGGLFATSEAARYVAQANKKAAAKPQGAQPLRPGASAGTVEAAGISAVRRGVTNKGAA